MEKFPDVKSYINSFSGVTKDKLLEMQSIIKSVVPEAEEIISYAMPAYKINGVLVYFAGNKNHIGFYPTGSGIKAFEKELGDYTWSKGALQFPLNEPLPVDLIKRMVNFRKEEDAKKHKK